MDLYQLKTFVTVARERSITRASELLHLSQPSVSAHIKAIEEAVGLTLFERTAKGMSLTADGQRLLAKAEQTLAAHQDLVDEASRIKGRVAGKLRLGASANSNNEAVGRLLTTLAQRYPDVEVVVKHGTSLETLAGIRNGSLDAGFYNEGGDVAAELSAVEVSRFGISVVGPPELGPRELKSLADVPWVYPVSSACCGQTAERLFAQHHFRPKRIVSVDREEITRTLVASGTGVGLLHADTAKDAEARGDVRILFESPTVVRVLFAHLQSRAQDPVVAAAVTIMRGAPGTKR